MITKSEVARITEAGLGIETFQHETLGHFNVTALREMVQQSNCERHRCFFTDIAMVDGVECDALEYLFSHREIDPQRCQELTGLQLEEPLIFLDCPPGSNGEQASSLLVDGIHRMKARRDRGYLDFWFYLIPLEQAPRIDPVEWEQSHIPWGEMEVVPGKGLVKRR